jgi:hypothetical protein
LPVTKITEWLLLVLALYASSAANEEIIRIFIFKKKAFVISVTTEVLICNGIKWYPALIPQKRQNPFTKIVILLRWLSLSQNLASFLWSDYHKK